MTDVFYEPSWAREFFSERRFEPSPLRPNTAVTTSVSEYGARGEDIMTDIRRAMETMPIAPKPITLIPSKHMVDTQEDWSQVRSPGRARRRRKQGHRQNIRYVIVPKSEMYHDASTGKIIGHPDVLAKLEVELHKSREKSVLDALRDGRNPW